MSYDPQPVKDGAVTTAKLGGDITALAKDLLQQETTTDAKDTLDVVAGAGGGMPILTL